tara:strand:+ start:313 stop:687 length:375 start_codon:yes stop_codon:yes gene_type:complete
MIFGLFKSKEARDIDKAKKFLKKALDNAKAIVLIDTKHHPEQILDLAVMFNDNNLKGINIMYRTAKDNNWPEEFDDELEMHIKFNDYNIKECFPKYVLSKKDYKKFEEVMQNALLGKFGEYKGV